MKRLSLRHLTRQRLRKEDISEVAAELRAMEDRPAAIVAATMVEDAVEDVILLRMKKLTKSEYSQLFLGNGLLATFSSKVRIAHAFKLLDKDWVRQINAIRDIRNIFAHARFNVDFGTPEILEKTKTVNVIDQYRNSMLAEFWKGSASPLHQIASSVRLHNPRERYMGACLYLAFDLWHYPSDPDDWDDNEA